MVKVIDVAEVYTSVLKSEAQQRGGKDDYERHIPGWSDLLNQRSDLTKVQSILSRIRWVLTIAQLSVLHSAACSESIAVISDHVTCRITISIREWGMLKVNKQHAVWTH